MYHHESSGRVVISLLIEDDVSPGIFEEIVISSSAKDDVSPRIFEENSYIIISEVLKMMYHHESLGRVVISLLIRDDVSS